MMGAEAMADEAPREPKLMTAKEVAAEARIHVKTFYSLCARGLGPRVLLIGPGRLRRYRPQDVARWLSRSARA